MKIRDSLLFLIDLAVLFPVKDGRDNHEEVLPGQPGRAARIPEGRNTGH
jgi:hypothetical protein